MKLEFSYSNKLFNIIIIFNISTQKKNLINKFTFVINNTTVYQ